MTDLKVLMLGWDEVALPAEAVHPSTLLLARALASQTNLSVLLPRLPKNEADLPAQAHVTGIGNLPLQELEAAEVYVSSEQSGPLQTPAFPYVGASVPASAGQEANNAATATTSTPAAESAQPALLDTDEFATEGAEPSTAEASALSQSEETIAPATPAPTPLATHLESSPSRASHSDALAVLSIDSATGDGLNFRVIQYARFATRLALQEQFAVIYAADWPAWLAALEIRQRTNRPLVLHVHTLAADRNTPDDRGWITELERLALRRADLVLVDSDLLHHRLISLYGLEPHRVRIQPVSLTPEVMAEGVRGVLEEAAHDSM